MLCASWRSCRGVSKCNSSRFGRVRGTCYFHKKLSFVKENGGANELESLRVTCRYDCLEVLHKLVKFRAKKFHFAYDHFVRARVSVPVVKKIQRHPICSVHRGDHVGGSRSVIRDVSAGIGALVIFRKSYRSLKKMGGKRTRITSCHLPI